MRSSLLHATAAASARGARRASAAAPAAPAAARRAVRPGAAASATAAAALAPAQSLAQPRRETAAGEHPGLTPSRPERRARRRPPSTPPPSPAVAPLDAAFDDLLSPLDGGGSGGFDAAEPPPVGDSERALLDRLAGDLRKGVAPALSPPASSASRQRRRIGAEAPFPSPTVADPEMVNRQLALEESSVEAAVSRYRRVAADARRRGDTASHRPAQALLQSWYHPVGLAVQRLATSVAARGLAPWVGPGASAAADGDRVSGDSPMQRRGKHQEALATVLDELSAEQLAVVTIHEGLAALLRRPEGVPFSVVATAVGRAVQAEVNMARLRQLRLSAGMPSPGGEVPTAAAAAPGGGDSVAATVSTPLATTDAPTTAASATAALARHMRGGARSQRAFDERALPKAVNAINYAAAVAEISDAHWDTSSAVTVGSALLDVLLRSALVPRVPPTFHTSPPRRLRRTGDAGRDVDGVAAAAAAASGPDVAETASKEASNNTAGAPLPPLSPPESPTSPPLPNFVPAFRHELRVFRSSSHTKRVGHLRISPQASATLIESDELLRQVLAPKWKPMVVPPRPWTSPNRGGYLLTHAPFIRTRPSRRLREALFAADLGPVLDGLNALSSQGWRVNQQVLDVATALWERGGGIAGLVSRENVGVPEWDPDVAAAEIAAERARRRTLLGMGGEDPGGHAAAAEAADEALDEAAAAAAAAAGDDDDASEERPRLDAAATALLRRRRSVSAAARAARKLNAERHSLRCDTTYKLAEATEYACADRTPFFLPHNIDFRGRAYPVPPFLHHMGADMTRGLFLFDASAPGAVKPPALGERGAYWLAVHLANLAGLSKSSLADRYDAGVALFPRAVAVAADPLAESSLSWWAAAEDPFQLLAACTEIAAATGRHGGRSALEAHVSSLPVQMDGSCNGLQHYAALGRDVAGGEAVNLVPGPAPRDVYTGVADLVRARVEADASPTAAAVNPSAAALATALRPLVSRKLVKQTVMTSVYGVTLVGARTQVLARLRATPEFANDPRAWTAAGYLSRLTLSSIGDLFAGATATMDWLGDCAAAVARVGSEVRWTTPLGLPVLQPYRRSARRVVRTVVQQLLLSTSGEHLPVLRGRQRTAFPPNYIHSLDSSHMLLTAAACHRLGLQFAAVHDSFWSNAATVDKMNEVLRAEFVRLHSRDLLAELQEGFLLDHPGLTLPPIPVRGELDVRAVLESPYFFS
ncbi:hypothetical protein MMPV_006316 [Pyropia vietnamensis]